MKVVTWNVNSIRVRLPQVLDWLKANGPDVVCLQETKTVDDDFPAEDFRSLGYNVIANGQKTYNGVATLSRASQTDVIRELPGLVDPQRRFLASSIGAVRVVNVYVPNGEAVGTDKYQYKLGWLSALTRHIAELLKQFRRILVLGDFNIAPEPRDVHDPALWEGRVLFSDREREALNTLMQAGLIDTFRRFEQPANSFSWWDYRQGGFRRNHGLRIDHILASDTQARACRACYIDKAPRALERPSDHAPVVAEFDVVSKIS